jgi:SPP1 family predicted phage head-tail adaptor
MAKLKYMKKDKKITILTYTESENELGETIQEWIPLDGAINIWAYYRQASAGEFYGAATTNYKVEAIFQIAWQPGLNTWMQVRYKDKDYRITRIDDFEGNKTDLKIYAYIVNP